MKPLTPLMLEPESHLVFDLVLPLTDEGGRADDEGRLRLDEGPQPLRFPRVVLLYKQQLNNDWTPPRRYGVALPN